MTLLLLLGLAHAAVPPSAARAIRMGDCDTALVALSGETGAAAALARAGCGQLDPLTPELRDDTQVGPYLRLLHARELLESDPDRVEALLVDTSLPGSAGLEARLLLGQALIAQGQSQAAKGDLRLLLETEVAPEARYWLAYGAESRDQLAPAIATYKATWARHATSPWAAKAAAQLAALGEPVPDYSTTEGRTLALTRAKNLVSGGQAPKAVPLYDGVTAATGDDSTGWTRQVAMVLFKAKDYPRAVEWLGRLGPEAGQADAETLYHYALALSRTGQHDASSRAYRRLVALYPATKRADTASYKLGYLEVDRGRGPAAEREFQDHLERYPTSRHGDEALWYLGWMAFQDGRWAEAEGRWQTLIRVFPKSSLAPPARYWWSRTRGLQGFPDEEREGLQTVVDRHPLSGSAWFAAEHLGLRFTGAGTATVPGVPAAFASAHPDVLLGQLLLRSGQSAWARERLGTVERAAAAQGRTTALALAHLAAEAGDGRMSKRLAAPWCGNPAEGGDPVALQACYPAPLADLVGSAAANSGLPPLLPYAIMTVESGLRPDVTSPAGARGLMQVMPALGAELHPLLFAGAYQPERLYEPGYNALLGTTELGRLQERWSSGPIQPSLPLVIAGYNGGVAAVERWQAGYAVTPSADRFCEDISYSETRRYVRKVLGALMAYRWVYGDPD